jgi:hypothetical protein
MAVPEEDVIDYARRHLKGTVVQQDVHKISAIHRVPNQPLSSDFARLARLPTEVPNSGNMVIG